VEFPPPITMPVNWLMLKLHLPIVFSTHWPVFWPDSEISFPAGRLEARFILEISEAMNLRFLPAPISKMM